MGSFTRLARSNSQQRRVTFAARRHEVAAVAADMTDLLSLGDDLLQRIMLQFTCPLVGAWEAASHACLDLSRGLPPALREELWTRLIRDRWPVEGPTLSTLGNTRSAYMSFRCMVPAPLLERVRTAHDKQDASWMLWPHDDEFDEEFPDHPPIVLLVAGDRAGICKWDGSVPDSNISRLIGWACDSSAPFVLPLVAPAEAMSSVEVTCYAIGTNWLCVRLFTGLPDDVEEDTDDGGIIYTFDHGGILVASRDFELEDDLAWDVYLTAGLKLKQVRGTPGSYCMSTHVVTVGEEGESGFTLEGLAKALWTSLTCPFEVSDRPVLSYHKWMGSYEWMGTPAFHQYQ